MDYFLLPEKIKSQLPPPGENPPFVMNASGGLDGSSGECYLVVFSGLVCVFYKSIGVDGFKRLDAEVSDPKFHVAVMKDKFNVILELASSAWSHKLKFSSFDAQKLDELALSLMAGRHVAAKTEPQTQQPQPPAAAEPSVELDSFVGLLAATMFVAGHDGAIDVSEDTLIKTIAGNDMMALGRALEVYKACAPMELASALSGIDREGRLCVVANMLDVAIADGLLKSSEQRLISDFATAMGLSNDDYATIRDVLVIKGKAPFLKSFRGLN